MSQVIQPMDHSTFLRALEALACPAGLPQALDWAARIARQQRLCLTMATRMDMDVTEIAAATGTPVFLVEQLLDSAIVEILRLRRWPQRDATATGAPAPS